ncbi:MAG: YdcF family protein [Desulfopila sp.]
MELRYVLKALLLPPFSQLLVLILAWRVRTLWPKTARALYLLALFSLWVLATPIGAITLCLSLEHNQPIRPDQLSLVNADAIVILSGAQNEAATEFGQPVSGQDTLIRLRYGAFLQRRTGLPILLTGGSVRKNADRSLAESMAFDLDEEFGLQARWLETKSRTTAENAQLSYDILQVEKKTTILLVTSSLHMQRATWSFRRVGFHVLPAPTGFIDQQPLTIRSFVPNAHSLQLSRDAIHEWLGYWAYRILPPSMAGP